MKSFLPILVLFIGFSLTASGQSYVVFERHQTINNQYIMPSVYLSENEVKLQLKDTTVSIFNFYFSTDTVDIYGLGGISNKYSKSPTRLINDMVVVSVPLVNPGEKLTYTEIDKEDLSRFQTLTSEQFYKECFLTLSNSIASNSESTSSLKTLKYKIIIKDKQKYYKVDHSVLTTMYAVATDRWYFPNEFRQGVLNVNPQFSKTYKVGDLKKIDMETGWHGYVEKNLTNRIYLSEVNTRNDFECPVFCYWELLGGDAESIYFKPKELRNYHPGLGSFCFIPKIGVINCTLNYYLKGRIQEDRKPHFDIISVNSLKPKDFARVLNNKKQPMSKLIEH